MVLLNLNIMTMDKIESYSMLIFKPYMAWIICSNYNKKNLNTIIVNK